MEKKSVPIRLTAKARDLFMPSKQKEKGQKENSLKDDRKTSFWDGKFAQLLLAPVIAAALVTGATLWIQVSIDNDRSDRESAREDTRADEAIRAANLMFVRDRSEDGANKPYSHMDLRGLTMSGLNFRGANLQFADLNGANIEGSNFSSDGQYRTNLFSAYLRVLNGSAAAFNDADMRFANMQDSSFLVAKFKGSDLRSASLKRSCLIGADFSNSSDRRTDLRNAKFDGSNLFGADFQGAMLDGASFIGANLSNVTGLTKEAVKVTLYDDNTTWPWEPESDPLRTVCEYLHAVSIQDDHWLLNRGFGYLKSTYPVPRFHAGN